MPFPSSSAARRTSSCQLVLPPSTIVSPGSTSSDSRSSVCCVGSPAGTINHTVRGGSSLETRSSSEEAPVAPWPSAVDTASSEKSNATTWWSESRCMRWTMLPPIRPRPTKPSCIRSQAFLESGDRADEVGGGQAHADGRPAVAAHGLEVAGRLGVDQRAERIGLGGNLEILGEVVHELEEAPRRRPALVELAGRVQVARAVA